MHAYYLYINKHICNVYHTTIEINHFDYSALCDIKTTLQLVFSLYSASLFVLWLLVFSILFSLQLTLWFAIFVPNAMVFNL